MVVLEEVVVFVEVEEPVLVLVIADETEIAGEDDVDLDSNVERVEVLVDVIVLVERDERVNSRVGPEEIVASAVFVDVLDAMEERVGRA